MALPATMNAWVYTTSSGGLEKNLKLTEIPIPEPFRTLKHDQVLVRVHAASLNPVDYKLAEMPIPVLGSKINKLPATPSRDFAGIVAATGKGNAEFTPGQRVFGRHNGTEKHGCLGEYIVATGAECTALPDAVSFVDGAAVGTAGMAALQSIKTYVKEGDSVFLNGGSSGVGTFGIQFARALGATSILTTCSASSSELCTSLGATEIIDYRSTDVTEHLKSKGPTLDLAADFIGTPTNLYKHSSAYLKPGAHFTQIGVAMSPAGAASLVQAHLPGFLGGGKTPFKLFMCQNVRGDFEMVGRWMAEGKVKPAIDRVYAWEQVPEAYTKLKSGRAKGKIAVEVIAAAATGVGK